MSSNRGSSSKRQLDLALKKNNSKATNRSTNDKFQEESESDDDIGYANNEDLKDDFIVNDMGDYDAEEDLSSIDMLKSRGILKSFKTPTIHSKQQIKSSSVNTSSGVDDLLDSLLNTTSKKSSNQPTTSYINTASDDMFDDFVDLDNTSSYKPPVTSTFDDQSYQNEVYQDDYNTFGSNDNEYKTDDDSKKTLKTEHSDPVVPISSSNSSTSPEPISTRVTSIISDDVFDDYHKVKSEAESKSNSNNNSNINSETAPVVSEPEVKAPTTQTISGNQPFELTDYIPEGSKDKLIYWYDLHELHDRVFLFGRMLDTEKLTNTHINLVRPQDLPTVSVCVEINNIQRDLYVLPRKYKVDHNQQCTNELVSNMDVMDELDTIMKNQKILNHRMKPVSKRYCFNRSMNTGSDVEVKPKKKSKKSQVISEVDEMNDSEDEENPDTILSVGDDIPESRRSLQDPYNIIPIDETDFINVRYSASYAALSRSIKGRTFSHILGSRSSLTELLLLDKKMVGPCWLRLSNAEEEGKLSYCDRDFKIHNQNNINLTKVDGTFISLPPPLFKITSLSLQSVLKTSKAGQHHELVLATLRTVENYDIEGGSLDHRNVKEIVIVRAPEPTLPNGKKSDKKDFFPFGFRDEVLKPDFKARFGNVILAPDEKSFLASLTFQLEKTNPDMLVSHGLHGIIIDMYMGACQRHNVQFWSKIGRLNTKKMPRKSGELSWTYYGVGTGRLLCDTLTSAKEFARYNDYSLLSICQDQFPQEFSGGRGNILQNIDVNDVPKYFEDSQNLIKLLTVNQARCLYTLKLMVKLDIIYLTKTLTDLCGNLWSSSLRSARADRVEYLLLHRFHQSGFIIPENYTKAEREEYLLNEGKFYNADVDDNAVLKQAKDGGKKKAKYSGGMVLEPKRGYYEQWVAVLDFNSLYPSIMREYNLCFSTVPHWRYNAFDDSEYTDEDLNELIPDNTVKSGILAELVKYLIDRRKSVKSVMKKATGALYNSYNTRQTALKLVANSMYGCLGYSLSRFYCQAIAAIITSKGRNTLANAVYTANNAGATIIYGDTDSIMVNTNTESYAEAQRTAVRVKTAINKNYKVLNIDEDAYFKSMLLLRKKKYGALKLSHVEVYDENKEKKLALTNANNHLIRRVEASEKKVYVFKTEAKGLDFVRGDWCPLSAEVSRSVLDTILSGKNRDDTVMEIKNTLTTFADRMDKNLINPEQYILTKTLTKNIESYHNSSLAHVKVALERKKRGVLVRAGDKIQFIMVKGDGTQADKAVDYDDFVNLQKQKKPLEIDILYYKDSQLLSPIMRLCEVFEEISRASIAEWLGLDALKYRNTITQASSSTDAPELIPNNSYEQFEDCDPLYIDCPHCNWSFPFLGVYNFAYSQSFLDLKTQSEKVVQDLPVHMNAATVGMLMHSNSQYRNKVNKAKITSGFICPNPTCNNVLEAKKSDNNNNTSTTTSTTDLSDDTTLTQQEHLKAVTAQICNKISLEVHRLTSLLNQHKFIYKDDQDKQVIVSHDLTLENHTFVNTNITTAYICKQLRYFSYLFDVQKQYDSLAHEYEFRLTKALGDGSNIKNNLPSEKSHIKWHAPPTGNNPNKITQSKTDVSQFFNEENLLINMTGFNSYLDIDTEKVCYEIKTHCDEILLTCDDYTLSLRNLFENLYVF